MRHHGRLAESCLDAAFGLQHLVLIAGHHALGALVGSHFVEAHIHIHQRGIVHIVNHQIALLAAYHRLTVGAAQGTALQRGHTAVAVRQRDAFLQIYSCGAHHAVAHHALHLCTEEHTREVDGIHAQVEQSAAAQFGPHDALLVVYLIAERGGEHPWTAYHTALQHLGYLPAQGHVAYPHGLGQVYPTLTRQPDECLGLVCIHSESLLHQACLAGKQSLAGGFVVVRMRGGDVEQLHIGVLQNGIVGAIRPLDAQRGGKSAGLLGRPRCHCLHTHLGHLGQCAGHLLGYVSGTDDAYVQCLHTLLLCF